MNRDCNLGRWYKNMPTSLPVLLVSGEDDPVGNYSKGVLEVEEGLKKQGVPVIAVVGAAMYAKRIAGYLQAKKAQKNAANSAGDCPSATNE